MPRSRPDGLGDVTEGDYLFDVDAGEVYEFISIDAEWNGPEGIFEGVVELRCADGSDETYEEDAGDVDFWIHNGQFIPVSERVLDAPDDVLVDFAQKEIGNYVTRLGNHHDFNGIDGVRVVADLRAAAFLMTYRDGS